MIVDQSENELTISMRKIEKSIENIGPKTWLLKMNMKKRMIIHVN